MRRCMQHVAVPRPADGADTDTCIRASPWIPDGRAFDGLGRAQPRAYPCRIRSVHSGAFPAPRNYTSITRGIAQESRIRTWILVSKVGI